MLVYNSKISCYVTHETPDTRKAPDINLKAQNLITHPPKISPRWLVTGIAGRSMAFKGTEASTFRYHTSAPNTFDLKRKSGLKRFNRLFNFQQTGWLGTESTSEAFSARLLGRVFSARPWSPRSHGTSGTMYTASLSKSSSRIRVMS